jgi:hypothetical protein
MQRLKALRCFPPDTPFKKCSDQGDVRHNAYQLLLDNPKYLIPTSVHRVFPRVRFPLKPGTREPPRQVDDWGKLSQDHRGTTKPERIRLTEWHQVEYATFCLGHGYALKRRIRKGDMRIIQWGGFDAIRD